VAVGQLAVEVLGVIPKIRWAASATARGSGDLCGMAVTVVRCSPIASGIPVRSKIARRIAGSPGSVLDVRSGAALSAGRRSPAARTPGEHATECQHDDDGNQPHTPVGALVAYRRRHRELPSGEVDIADRGRVCLSEPVACASERFDPSRR